MIELLVSGNGDAITLRKEDKLIYLRAVKSLEPTGIPLDRAASDFAAYWQQMGGDFFKEAVAEYIKRRDTVKPIMVPKLVELFIEQKTKSTKRNRPASADYLKDLNSRLGKFKDSFSCPVTSVTPDLIMEFLDDLDVEGRTRFNYARLLRTLFRFAQSRRFYPRDIDPMEGIDIEYEDAGEIGIFTTEEITRLLMAARPEMVPFISLGGFAGLRHAEIKRLDWQEVDLERGFIEVKASKAKTRSRRLVPISDNLKNWLADHKKENGPVTPFANCTKQLLWLVDKVNEIGKDDPKLPKLKWKYNGLRHSFISYRLAKIQNTDRVALEAGNSPQTVFKNYRELVRPDQAEAWFGIMPPQIAATPQTKTAA